MRVFAGLPIPEEVALALGKVLDPLKRRYPRLRAVRREGLHITLFFFGELAETQVAELEGLMDDTSLVISTISASLGRVDCFPERGNPRVIYCGLSRGREEVADLYLRYRKLIDRQYQEDEKEFIPHITLARNKGERIDRRDLKNLAIEAGDFRVDRLVLYQSILRPQGAEYKPLKTVTFRTTQGEVDKEGG